MFFKNALPLLLLIFFSASISAGAEEPSPEKGNSLSHAEATKQEFQTEALHEGYFALSIAALLTQELSENGHGNAHTYKLTSGAVLFEIGANDFLGLQTGLMVMEHQSEVANAAYSLQQSVQRLKIPVWVKIWLWDFLSISGGPYMGFAISGTESRKTIITADTGNLHTTADHFLEFGFDIGLTLNLPLNKKNAIFLEARYYDPYDKTKVKHANSVYGLLGYSYRWNK